MWAHRRGDGQTRTKRLAFRSSRNALRWNKWVEPYDIVIPERDAGKGRKRDGNTWRLEESAWKVRERRAVREGGSRRVFADP